ncbi:Aldehyde dehydrogenase [Balamuthia mandrillaris]
MGNAVSTSTPPQHKDKEKETDAASSSSSSGQSLDWEGLRASCPASPAPAEVPEVVEGLRANFDTGATRSLEWRLRQLKAIEQMVLDNEKWIVDAAAVDLHRAPVETVGFEMAFCLDEVRKAQKELKSWVSPKKHSVPLLLKLDGSCNTYPEPKGVVLIIAPWNGPWALAVIPLIGAIAAGNCAVLKPSELAPHASLLLASQVPKYLDNTAVRVVEGDASIAKVLLQEQWDHIFYTGGGRVAKFVAKAAAEYLTPLTLELGGKNPCFIDRTANIPVAARRIAWAKCVNGGQVCMSPDYLLVEPKVMEPLMEALKANIKEFYGNNPLKSPDFSKIISEGHFKRVLGLLQEVEENVLFGGTYDEETLTIAPTFIREPPLDSSIMEEEIFAPLCSVFPVTNLEAAIKFIKRQEKKNGKPLFAYMFSSNSADIETFVQETSSGQVGVNDCMMNYSVIDAPFGGNGASGMGSYRGKHSFDTFSNFKSVLKRGTWLDPAVRYPPYDESKLKATHKLFVQGSLF